MTTIKQQDFIASIADALQFISYYHPQDYIEALGEAYQAEQSPAAKDAIAQILTNSRMCAEGHRPICQDTGIVVAFVKVGMDVRWDGATMSIAQMVDEGVRRAYLDPDNKLRASIVADPAGARKNTRDNTPAVVALRSGSRRHGGRADRGQGRRLREQVEVRDAQSLRFDRRLGPEDGADDGRRLVPARHARHRHRRQRRESVADGQGSADGAHRHARAPAARAAQNATEELRLELFDKVNALGIGAQGLGGLSTVLDVKILDYPTHAASKPVAMIPNCAATRHAHFTLDGSGAAKLVPPDLARWPDVQWVPAPTAKRVDLDHLTPAEVATWKPGETLLLSGRMLTGRDAAHKRIADLFAKGEPLPPGVDFTNRVIYYVGPVDPVRDEVVGPAGPTTSTRMDKFTEMMLARTGLVAMIGKAERGPVAIEAIRKHRAAYLMAVGGAAYLVSKAILSSRVVAFGDLGMEAIYEFDVRDMPVTVAVDANGTSVHQTGPREWQQRIGKIPLTVP